MRGWDLHVCASTVVAALPCVDVCIVKPGFLAAVLCEEATPFGEAFVYCLIPIESCGMVATVPVKVEAGWNRRLSSSAFVSSFRKRRRGNSRSRFEILVGNAEAMETMRVENTTDGTCIWISDEGSGQISSRYSWKWLGDIGPEPGNVYLCNKPIFLDVDKLDASASFGTDVPYLA